MYIYKHILSIHFLTSFLWVLCLKKALKYDFSPKILKPDRQTFKVVLSAAYCS